MRTHSASLARVCLLAASLFTTSAAAADLSWDNTATDAGATLGGAGTWDLATAKWWNGSGYVTWANANNDTAIFNGTGGTVTLGANVTAGSLTFTSGVTGYTLTGNTLTLNAASSGATTITANESATINSGISLSGNTQRFTVASGKTLTLGGIISGSQTLTYAGAGSYTLGGVNTHSGNITIDAATVTVNSGATLFGSSLGWSNRTVTLQNGGVLRTGNFGNGAGNLWGQIGDHSSNITFGSDGGTFEFTGATMDSSVNKGFDVGANNTGTFRVGAGVSSTWSGENNGRDFNAQSGATLVFDLAGDFSTSRELRGSGGFTKRGAGTLTLSGVNGFTGTLTIEAGTVLASSGTSGGTASATGDNNAIVVNANGTLRYTGARGAGYHAGNVTLNGGKITFDAADMSFASGRTITFDSAPGTIDGSGQLRRRDSGNRIAVTAAASGSVISVAELNLLNNTPQFDVADGAQGADLTVSSLFSGGAGISKSGAGTLLLNSTAAGSNVGAITISAGTLEISGLIGNGTSGAHTSNISNAGVLRVSSASNQSMSGVISGAGSLTKSGNGTLTLSNASNTYSGSTTVAAGTLEVGGVLGGGAYSGDITLSGGTLRLTGASNQTFSGTISGAGALRKTGGGTLTLSGPAVAAGAVQLDAGGLSLASGLSASFASLTFGGNVAITLGSLSNYASTPAIAVSGALDLGSGTITLNLPTGGVANGTYRIIGHGGTLAGLSGFALGTSPVLGARQTGGLADNAGSVDFVVSGNTPYWTGATNGAWDTSTTNWKLITGNGDTQYITNDTVVFNDSATGTTAVTLASAVTPASVAFDNSAKNYTLSGAAGIAGAAILTKSGSGTLTINNANSHTGGTVINAGTVVVGDAGALGSGAVTLGGGTLDLGGLTVSNTLVLAGGAVSGNGGGVSSALNLGGAALSLSVASDTTLSGVISNGALTKTGAGRLILTAANTHTGGTTVSNGTLQVGAGGATGSLAGAVTNNAALVFDRSVASAHAHAGAISGTGSLAVAAGSALRLTGFNTYTGATTVGSGATLTIGNGSGSGSATATSGIANSGALVYDAGSSGTAGLVAITGSGSLTASGRVLRLNGDITQGSAVSLTQLGSGGAYLDGINLSKSGTTTITAASISISGDIGKADSDGNALALDTSAAGGTIDLDVSLGRSGVFYIPTGLTANAGAGAINVTGTGIADSGWRSTPVTLTGGVVTVSANVGSDAAVTINNASTSTVSGAFSGGMGLTKGGNGTLILTGANSHTGGTTVSAGTLQVSGSASGSLGAMTLQGNLAKSGTGSLGVSSLLFNRTTGTQSLTLSEGSITLGGTLKSGENGGNFTHTQTGGSFTVTATGSNEFSLANWGGTSSVDISAGTLSVSTYWNPTVGQRGTGNLTIGGTAEASFASTVGASLTLGGQSSGTGNLYLNGGRLTLSRIVKGDGAGNLYLDGGTLRAAASNNTNFLSGLTSARVRVGGATIDTNGFDVTIGQSLAEDATSVGGGLTKTGAGTLTLTGNNTFTGGLTVSAGTLVAGSANALGTGAVSVTGGTLRAGGASAFATGAITVNGGTLDLGGHALSTGITYLSGSITGAGSFAGSINVGGGTLAFGSLSGFGTAAITVGSGATLDLGGFNPTNAITLAGGQLIGDGNWAPASVTLAGNVSAATINSLAAPVVNFGNGAVVNLDGVNKQVVLNGNATVTSLSTFTGSLAVAGTLDLSSAGNRPGQQATIELRSGGVLNFGSATPFAGNVAYKGGAIQGAFSGTITVAEAGVALTDANISGGTVVVGTGASVDVSAFTGTVRLTGNGSVSTGLSTFSGDLELGAGANLDLTSVSVPNATITVASGGTLGGSGSVGAATLATGGTLNPGNSPGTQTFASLVVQANSTLDLEILNTGGNSYLPTAGTDYDAIVVTGLLDLSQLAGGKVNLNVISLLDATTDGDLQDFDPNLTYAFDLIRYGEITNYGGSISEYFNLVTTDLTYDGAPIDPALLSLVDTINGDGYKVIQLQYAPIPEPSTYGLILGGLALAGAAVRRRRAKRA